jgi:hypothetical protein
MPRNIESNPPFPGSTQEMDSTIRNIEIEKRHNEAANYLEKLTARKANLDELEKKIKKQ